MYRRSKDQRFIAYATQCFRSRPERYINIPVSFKVRARDRMRADKLARSELKRKYGVDWKDLSLIRIS